MCDEMYICLHMPQCDGPCGRHHVCPSLATGAGITMAANRQRRDPSQQAYALSAQQKSTNWTIDGCFFCRTVTLGQQVKRESKGNHRCSKRYTIAVMPAAHLLNGQER